MQIKIKHAIFPLLMGILLFSLAGCGNEESGSEAIPTLFQPPADGAFPTTSELCANPLFPAAQGAAWVYASVGGPSGAFIYTNTITEARDDGFTLTAHFIDQTRAQEWSCRPEGLAALELGGGNAAGVSMQDMTVLLEASDVSGITLPKNITSGMQWQYNLRLQGSIVMPGDPEAPASGSYSSVMREMGWETVSVPAGDFDALKIQSDSTVDILSSFGGAELPIRFSGVTLTWYAPGVGYVKAVESGDFGGQTYSITTELQSYNIP
jgi:hypothetical protein